MTGRWTDRVLAQRRMVGDDVFSYGFVAAGGLLCDLKHAVLEILVARSPT